MSMATNLVNRDRKAYNQHIQTLIEAMGRAFFNGDVDKAWEKFFAVAEEDAAITGEPMVPSRDDRPRMWIRPIRKPPVQPK